MVHGRIEINEALCKGCDFCAMVCPYKLIHTGEHFNAKGYRPALFADPQQHCTGCTLCAMICPDAVITVYREVKIMV
jgi:2-oxoglutarate ferredoxin oxidoreductase subunit delta